MPAESLGSSGPSRGGASWDREFLAGWFDGMRAAKVKITNRFQVQLERFELKLDARGRVKSRGESESIEKESGVLRDNPENHPGYDQGWDKGYHQTYQLILERVRSQLSPRKLQVTDRGTITSAEVSNEILRLFKKKTEGRKHSVTDQEIHAFIDGVLDTKAAVPRLDGLKFSGKTRGLMPRLFGALNMIRKKVDRRVAIMTLGGILATTSVSLVAWQLGRVAVKTQATQTRTYVAPTWWDGMPADLRNYNLALDQVFWGVESTQPAPTSPTPIHCPFNPAGALVLATMSQTGNSSLKCKLADFIRSSQRAAYLPYLIPGLNPKRSTGATRSTVASALAQLHDSRGPSMFSSEVRAAILGAYRGEREFLVKRNLDRVLTSLGIAH